MKINLSNSNSNSNSNNNNNKCIFSLKYKILSVRKKRGTQKYGERGFDSTRFK